jgi:hypothetical protein
VAIALGRQVWQRVIYRTLSHEARRYIMVPEEMVPAAVGGVICVDLWTGEQPPETAATHEARYLVGVQHGHHRRDFRVGLWRQNPDKCHGRDRLVLVSRRTDGLELLAAYHSSHATGEEDVVPERTSGRLRNLFEFLFFGWFIPGSSPRGRAVVKLAAATALMLVFLFAAYVGWVSWDMRRLRLFCEDLHPGMPRASIDQVGERHGIDKRWLDRDGTFDEHTKDWVLLVRAASHVGNFACAIHYKDDVVVAAEVWGP